ncbi:MAG: hypothetical protein BMS9Abin37_2530 [Acidobacteriota bacterium]|nr:MAG: hypothetical protein BMS9Abin37_2530 [Acidobacteriota bacterium]
MRVIAVVWLLSSSIILARQEAAELYSPTRFLSGKTPEQPPLASAGGLTFLELDIAPSGIVTDAIVLDEAAPFTEVIQKAAVLWRFQPAEIDGGAIRAKALVVGVFRPPILMGAVLPGPKSVRPPSEGVPYPVATSMPEYPPNALYEGVAVVEVAIDTGGAVVEAKMLSPEEGYDEVALEAAWGFRFRAARYEGRAVESFALIFFGFRQPVTTPWMPPH